MSNITVIERETPVTVQNLRRHDCPQTVILEVNPRTGHEGAEGEYRYSSTLSLTSALDEGWVVNVTPRPLYPRERPGTHCVGGWTGTRAGLDEFDPRTVQPVAIRYTD